MVVLQVDIEKEIVSSVHNIIEVTKCSLRELEKLASEYGKNPPIFLSKEIDSMVVKLSTYTGVYKHLFKEKIINDKSCRSISVDDELNARNINKNTETNVFNDKQGIKKNKSSKRKIEERKSIKINLTDFIDLNQVKSSHIIFIIIYPRSFYVTRIINKSTIYEVLNRILTKHNLNDKNSVLTKLKKKKIIPWNTQSSSLSSSNITVIPSDIYENYTVPNDIHILKPSTMLNGKFCKICHRLTTKYFRCKRCKYTFHKKCILGNSYDITCHGKNSCENRFYDNVISNEKNETSNLTVITEETSGGEVETVRNNNYFERSESDDELNTKSTFYTISDLKRLCDIAYENEIEINYIENSYSTKQKKITHTRPMIFKSMHEDYWELDINQIIMGGELGSGTFGTVYKGFWFGFVAVKLIKLRKITREILIAFKNEVTLLRKCRHKNIVLFMGCVNIPVLAIITEWCDGSTLYTHLHVYETEFDHKQLCDYSHQIADGMDYLHHKNIMHRDLKSNNIFLVENHLIKIGDFGLATVKTAAAKAGAEKGLRPTGSVLWMAPEVIRKNEELEFSFASDVYSYGIILYELLSKSLPYPGIDCVDAILYLVGQGILKPDYSIIKNERENKNMIDISIKCISYDPKLRPTFREVVESVSKAFYVVPIIARTTSCLVTKDGDSSLNMSQSSINLIQNSYLIPSYVSNLKEAHSTSSLNNSRSS